MPDFVCVLREPEFSPGKVEDDAAILLHVASLLRRERYVVDVLDPRTRRWPELPRRTVVLSMAQGEQALEQLQRWERKGLRVINSVNGVRNCHRIRTVPLWQHAGCTSPPAAVVATNARTLPEWVQGVAAGVWVKRGDVHAMTAEDVQFAADGKRACEVLERLRLRGIAWAVVQRHVSGRSLKFYGVTDRFFFLVGASGECSAQVEREVARLARQGAAALGVEIFGGDCVVDDRGRCHLIDLNDWPSYAACRQAAAEAIAAYARTEKAKVA